MNLNSEMETLKEIDDLIMSTSFKTQLSKQAPLDPDDIMNESFADMSQMPSLYLTEPSMATRNLGRVGQQYPSLEQGSRREGSKAF